MSHFNDLLNGVDTQATSVAKKINWPGQFGQRNLCEVIIVYNERSRDPSSSKNKMRLDFSQVLALRSPLVSHGKVSLVLISSEPQTRLSSILVLLHTFPFPLTPGPNLNIWLQDFKQVQYLIYVTAYVSIYTLVLMAGDR